MWIERLLASKTIHAIELCARFAEKRHKVLAENVANIDTPGFQSKRLDAPAFQVSLRTALGRAREVGSRRLNLRGNAQFRTDSHGRLKVKPASEPAANILFHDGTNARVEELMTDVAENAMSYNLSVNLLRGRFDSLLTAIRGRTT